MTPLFAGTCTALTIAAIAVSGASADNRLALRAGVMPLDLVASSETPLFGGQIDRAVDAYNATAAARGMSRIDEGDLAVRETLLTLAPGVELGGEHYFFRLEMPLGFADNLTAIGVGIYPVNSQARLGGSAVGYVSAGGTASWLDRPG